MFNHSLTAKQLEITPLIKNFAVDYYLVGGSALALQIGHRYSIDFDLFTFKKIESSLIDKKIARYKFHKEVVHDSEIEYTLTLDDVKITFFQYAYPIPHPVKWNNVITMPTVLDIAAMKVYAIGKRAKWKDYVDLYFIFKYHASFQQVSRRAEQLFGGLYNEKLLREQLSYFKDINYTEKVIFLNKSIAVSSDIVKHYLTDIALKRI